MEGAPVNTINQDFNPYVATGAPYDMGIDQMIYEPLIEFNLAAPPQYYPWLATKFAWSNAGKAITFTIRNGVKWSDGTALTPADVAFSFNLMKKNPAINSGGLNIVGVSTSGNTVTVRFPTPQFSNLQNIAGLGIVPEHIWSTVGNPATYADANPVGTGPYLLHTFTPQGVTLVANPNYWQGEPHVQSIIFPVYVTNASAASALLAGQVDWEGNYIVGLQKSFIDTAPAFHHYWGVLQAPISFEPNLTKWPTNQLPVRQAITLALNRKLISVEAESNLEAPVLNATGLPLPTFAAYNVGLKSVMEPLTGSIAGARSILKKAGYTLNSDGYFEKDGKVVSFDIVNPSAYSNQAATDAIAAQELKAAGIDATFVGMTVSAWNAAIADGNFQMMEIWGSTGITPYIQYDSWLDSSLARGNSATGDWERLDNPAIDADLARLAGAATVAQGIKDLIPIEQFVENYLPIIPVTAGADFFEYNSQRFVGWPSAADPYEEGGPGAADNGPGSGTEEVIALRLRPRG
jgi:peptide/nickel transport system substrate-binding protein